MENTIDKKYKDGYSLIGYIYNHNNPSSIENYNDHQNNSFHK